MRLVLILPSFSKSFQNKTASLTALDHIYDHTRSRPSLSIFFSPPGEIVWKGSHNVTVRAHISDWTPPSLPPTINRDDDEFLSEIR